VQVGNIAALHGARGVGFPFLQDLDLAYGIANRPRDLVASVGDYGLEFVIGERA